jgi:hypothetical protein
MAATLITVVPSAFAQAQTKTSDTTTTQTFTGCLMLEPAYRKAHNLGSGALGGVGLGDEYVLVDAKVSPATGVISTTPMKNSDMKKEEKAEEKTEAKADASMAANACADQGMAFRVTGTAEERLKGMVGHDIEIQGRFKHADDTGNTGTPASGKLPAEVVIESFRNAPSPAVATAPVAPPPPMTPATPVPPPQTPAMQPAPVPVPATAPTQPEELPHTASASDLIVLVGLFSLFAAGAVKGMRRRAL